MRTWIKRAPNLGASALFFAAICALTLFTGVVEAAVTISGTPNTRFGTNSWYSFQPTASDPASKTALRYSITNKPNWAKFSTSTGRLEGATPATAGTYSNIRISVRSSTGTASLPAFSIQVYSGTSGDGGTTNRPPVLSGTPTTSVTAGSAYSFRPTGSDPEGRTLTWSITNRPSWATFSTTTGALTGTPSASNVGTFSNIVISASDGTNRTSLPAFNIAVVAQGSSSGSASLSWTPPTTNTNGTQLTNLAGYRIYYGTSPSSLTRTVQLSNAGLTRYVISDLSPATYYFSIRAYSSTGAESSGSNVVTKVVQ
ncbi:MAG TPA: putative Ig domain-containing protein [Steroidobacter sp.]|uniref:putative Ig domain-containing protein n=1 Tax=Steroidobacter sp. TaxID=1978227 RepID=UPI002ED90880